MLDRQKLEAQQILDELFSEHLLPFQLTAHKFETIGAGEYIIRFHDSRLTSLDVSCPNEQGFKTTFRTAILERVGRLSASPFRLTILAPAPLQISRTQDGK